MVLELLRTEADVADPHVARDRPVVAAQVVAEGEPHDVLQHQPRRDRGDGRRQRALAAQRHVRHAIEEQADRAGDGEGDGQRRHDLQARARWRRSPRRRRASPRPDREVREAQHGEHGGEADGGHRQQRARHQAVDESLKQQTMRWDAPLRGASSSYPHDAPRSGAPQQETLLKRPSPGSTCRP